MGETRFASCSPTQSRDVDARGERSQHWQLSPSRNPSNAKSPLFLIELTNRFDAAEHIDPCVNRMSQGSQELPSRSRERGVVRLPVVEAERARHEGRFHFKTRLHRKTMLGTLFLPVDVSTEEELRVEVTFELDVNGSLTVSACDLATGRTRRLVMPAVRPRIVNETLGETPAASDRRRGLSEIQATPKVEDDQRSSRVIRSVAQLRDTIHETFLTLVGQLTRREISKVVAAIERANEIEPGASSAEIESASRELLEAAAILGSAILRLGH